MPAMIRGVSPTTTALLVETQAADFATLSNNVRAIADALETPLTLRTPGWRPHPRMAVDGSGPGLSGESSPTTPAGATACGRIRKGCCHPWAPCGIWAPRCSSRMWPFPFSAWRRPPLDLQNLFAARLPGSHHFRSRPGRQPAFRLFAQFRQADRSGPLRPLHGRHRPHGGGRLRRIAQGRARHRPQHGPFCRKGVGQRVPMGSCRRSRPFSIPGGCSIPA
jgi:hypothetical protein